VFELDEGVLNEVEAVERFSGFDRDGERVAFDFFGDSPRLAERVFLGLVIGALCVDLDRGFESLMRLLLWTTPGYGVTIRETGGRDGSSSFSSDDPSTGTAVMVTEGAGRLWHSNACQQSNANCVITTGSEVNLPSALENCCSILVLVF